MKNDPNHDRDSDHAANDNGDHERPGGKQVAPAPAGGALASLATLQAALSSVDTSSLVVGSGRPLMLFKSREGGIWVFGRKRTTPETDSQWAFNPLSFRWGFVCFDDQNKPTERMVSISQPKPDVTTLPDLGFPWQEQRAVDMRCLSGADAGVEVTLKVNTVGGVQAIDGMIEAVLNRLNSGQHENKVVPIALLKNDSYQHVERGKIWIPVLDIVDWMSLERPAPAPAPVEPTPPVDQPRRRRVA